MKNVIKRFGIIALAAMIGFSMAACDNNTNPPGLNSGASLSVSSTLANNNIAIVGASNGSNEANAIEVNVTIPYSQKDEAVFIPAFASGSAGAKVTAYLGDDTGGGEYVALVKEGYEFSEENTTLWVRVISEDGKKTNFYKIVVEVEEEKVDLQSGAELESATLGGIAATLGTPDEEIEAVTAGSVTLAFDNNKGVKFEFDLKTDSSEATVTVRLNGSEDHIPEDYNFQNGDFLLIKVVSEDGKKTNFYKINVTVEDEPYVPQSGAELASATLGSEVVTLGAPADKIEDIIKEGWVTLEFDNSENVKFEFDLKTDSDKATVTVRLNGGEEPDASEIGNNPDTTILNPNNNDILWVKVVAQNGDTNFYKIVVTVKEKPLQSGVELIDVKLGGEDVTMNSPAASIEAAKANPASVKLTWAQRADAEFEFDFADGSDKAEVTILLNSGKKPAELKIDNDPETAILDLQANRYLWIKVVAEDLTTRFYLIEVEAQVGVELIDVTLSGESFDGALIGSPILDEEIFAKENTFVFDALEFDDDYFMLTFDFAPGSEAAKVFGAYFMEGELPKDEDFNIVNFENLNLHEFSDLFLKVVAENGKKMYYLIHVTFEIM